MMDAARIEAEAPAWRVQCHEEVTSTNDLAIDASRRGEPGFLAIFAESQTAGRGQRSNRWVTPPGKDLMCSMLLRPTLPMECWPRLTTLAALAVCKAIEAMLPLKPLIKWPNDIYIGTRKVCGLLAETHGTSIVLGIGLNVNCTAFAPEIADTATSLLRELPATIRALDREAIAAALLNEVHHVMHLWEHDFHQALAEVRARSLLIGKNIRALVNSTPIHGRVLDLNHEGHLVLQLRDGSTTMLSSAAEVRLD